VRLVWLLRKGTWRLGSNPAVNPAIHHGQGSLRADPL